MSSGTQQSPPPGARAGRSVGEGLLQPMANGGRDGSMQRVMAQHLFHVRKFAASFVASLLGEIDLLLFLGSKFGVVFHDGTQADL
jgi:hypothetical protein